MLHASGAHHEALAAARAASPHPLAEDTAWGIADRLGWFREARALAEGALRGPRAVEARWRARLLGLCLRWGDLPSAVVHGARAVALVPGSAALWLELGRALARSGDSERALASAARATALLASGPARPDGTYHLEAAAVALEAGSAALAERYLGAAATLDAASAAPYGELSRLAAWAGSDDEARALAQRALALDPSFVGAHRVLGALSLARGELDLAERHLQAAGLDDPETRLLLAEVALERGDLPLATARLPGAYGAREGPPHAVTLVRAAILAREGGQVPTTVRADLLPLLSDVCPELSLRLEAGEPDAWLAALDAGRARLRANRSPTLFHAPAASAAPRGAQPDGAAPRGALPGDASILVRAGPRGTARHDARAVLESVRIVEPEELLSRLRSVEAAYPSSSLPACHAGELLLWLGRLPEARAALERSLAINVATRWAYIGLTLLESLEGHPERGLETSARGVQVMHGEGPAVGAYRGEALRRAGRLSEALEDLERAAKAHPDRLAVWPSLGLARLALHQGSANDALEELARRAPGLLSDAARARGISLEELDEVARTSATTARDLLEATLELLRGNRSSTCVTYLSPEGALRSVSRGGPGPGAALARDLEGARALLGEGRGRP